MKKIIFSILTLIMFLFSSNNVVYAAPTAVGATGGAQGTGGATPCSGGTWSFCYTTRGSEVGDDGNGSHIGLRFSIVDSSGKNVGGYIQDYLTAGLIAQIQNVSSQNISINIMKQKMTKLDIVLSDWYGFNNSLIAHANADNIQYNNNSWFMGTFENYRVTTDSDVGTQIYERIFGSDNNLVSNYNAGVDARLAGNSPFTSAVNVKPAVFENGDGSDYGVLNQIIKDLTNQDPETKLQEMINNGWNLQIEVITMARVTANTDAGNFKYVLYGTTAELRAMFAQIRGELMDADYSNPLYFNASNNQSVLAGLFNGTQSALNLANAGMFYKEKFYNEYADLGGDDGACNKVDWITPEKHNCGIGVIKFSDLGISNPTCEIVDNTDAETIGSHPKLYYDSGGRVLNFAEDVTNIKEAFINSCVCPSGEYSTNGPALWSNYYAEGSGPLGDKLDYKTSYCDSPDYDEETPPPPSFKTCNPSAETNVCTPAEIKAYDDKNCIFNSINTNVKTNIDDGTHSKYYNEYCSVACAEDIKFEFPSRMDTVKAGTYFTMLSDAIKATGLRECRGTYDWNAVKNQVSNTLSDSGFTSDEQIKNVVSDMYTGYGSFKTFDSYKNKYSLVTQNEALTKLYNSYEEQGAEGEEWWNYYTDTSGNYCARHHSQLKSKYSDEVFDKHNCIVQTANGWSETACPASYPSSYISSTGKTPDEVKKAIAQKISEIAGKINTESEKINKCVTNFKEIKDERETTYDFKPEISFSYNEPYTTFFANKKFNGTDVSTNLNPEGDNTTSFITTKISYNKANSDFSALTNGESQYDRPSSDVMINKISKTRVYSSPINFYTVGQSGIVTVKDGSNYSDINGNTYNEKYVQSLEEDGKYIFPVALKTSAGDSYEYHLVVSKLGDREMLAKNSSTGRMDNLIPNNKKDYKCYYGVDNDVTSPDKLKFFYRNISLNNFDPNGRANNNTLGKNWQDEKGKITQCDIARGTYEYGSCFIQDNDTPEEIYDETPEYFFTLTPDNMIKIKEYNRLQETAGRGYADFNMTKVELNTLDKTGSNILSEGIWYTSDFIRNNSACRGSSCYFAEKRVKDASALFEKWTNNVEKNSGTGPAWK